MSNKQLVLDEIKQAQQILLEIKSAENKLTEYRKPVPVSVKNFLFVAFLSILVFSVYRPESGSIWFISVIMIATTLIFLRKTSKKLTEQKLEDNKERINELTKKKKELNHSLDTLNIGPRYLDLKILNKFEHYLRNNLAETLKECAQEYVREIEREERMAELRKIQAKQDELLDEFIRVKENKEPFELEDFKRRKKID
ncbi:hypothetical protein [Psychrobacillus soli]|uniref:Uncharacterized protein n=1 Tax=Psychrobacillus soli TaxID=1543965 RepID=A0A544TBC6_9BACI|nr:hypothetical protein [Psychrobacillus soli]TQR14743.1 hypothetical protein FG383_10505 [Psychrobacillus soli]